MKIAYLFGSLNRGGTETLMLDVCKYIADNNFDAIGVYRKGGVLEQDFINTDLPFYQIKTEKNPLSYILKLRKRLLAEKIDVAHTQQPIDALYAYFACIGTNIKVVLTLHGFDYSASHRLHKFILRKTVANIYVSDFQRKYYTKKYQLEKGKQYVVYNGIDFTKFENINKTDVREEINVNKGTLLLGMVGNFNEVRDQITICKFIKLLNDKKINFHFLFVGKRIESTPERFDNCVKYCKDNNLTEKVTFLGVRNDVPEILNQLDAFIYATDHDTFGIAVVEAIANGVPVFVNDWEVMKEVTENGKYATLYKSKDEMNLLAKFIVFLQDRESYLQKNSQISRLVKERYSIKTHFNNLITIYRTYA